MIETVYTLEDAEKILDLKRKQRRARQIAMLKISIAQKLIGLFVITIGIIGTMVLDGNAAYALALCPMGIFMVVTRKRVLPEWR